MCGSHGFESHAGAQISIVKRRQSTGMLTGRFDDNCSRSDGVIISTEVHGTLNNKNVLIFGFDTEVGKTSTVKILKPEA
jgi:cobyric acid synthase